MEDLCLIPLNKGKASGSTLYRLSLQNTIDSYQFIVHIYRNPSDLSSIMHPRKALQVSDQWQNAETGRMLVQFAKEVSSTYFSREKAILYQPIIRKKAHSTYRPYYPEGPWHLLKNADGSALQAIMYVPADICKNDSEAKLEAILKRKLDKIESASI